MKPNNDLLFKKPSLELLRHMHRERFLGIVQPIEAVELIDIDPYSNEAYLIHQHMKEQNHDHVR